MLPVTGQLVNTVISKTTKKSPNKILAHKLITFIVSLSAETNIVAFVQHKKKGLFLRLDPADALLRHANTHIRLQAGNETLR